MVKNPLNIVEGNVEIYCSDMTTIYLKLPTFLRSCSFDSSLPTSGNLNFQSLWEFRKIGEY